MKKGLLLTTLAASALAVTSNAQTFKSTDGTKFVLVEESTGAWCQYCPDGAVRLADLMASNPKVIGVSIHGGSGADNMKFADGTTVTNSYFTAFPLGLVDRADPSNLGGSYSPAMDRGKWATAATARAAVAPDFDVAVSHSFSASTMVVTATVTAKALKAVTGDYNINLYVVEDSVTGTGSGWNQVNFYNTQSGHPYYNAGNPIVGFKHMHVVRAMLGGATGTASIIPSNAAAGSKGLKSYTYTLPAGSNYKHFKLVAMVVKSSTDAKQRIINNAVESDVTVGTATSIGNTPALGHLEVYPNPASDNVRVTGTIETSSAIRLTLTNAVGQTIISREVARSNAGQCDETISVSSLSNGIYFLNVRSGEGQNTVQIVVNH